MPQFDISTFSSTIFWLIVSFTVFFVFYNKVVLPKLNSLITQRTDTLNQRLQNAEAYQAQAKALHASAQQKMGDEKRHLRLGYEAAYDQWQDKITAELETVKNTLATERNALVRQYHQRVAEMSQSEAIDTLGDSIYAWSTGQNSTGHS